jgi:hypothetical protein
VIVFAVFEQLGRDTIPVGIDDYFVVQPSLQNPGYLVQQGKKLLLIETDH